MDFIGGLPLSLSLIGAGMGVAGGVLNSFTKNSYKLVAFGIWIISNTVLAYWTYIIGEYGVTVMYLMFIVTSSFGFYNHWMVEKNGNNTKC